VVLADVRDPALPARTRGASQGRWLDLPRLLQGAPADSSAQLVVSERKWPWPSQVQALLEALQGQPHVRQLQLRVAEQLSLVDAKRSAAVAALVEQLCGGLASRAPQQVTSLQLSLGYTKLKHLPRVSAALAQLPSLQQLSYSGCNLLAGQLPSFHALASLTALTINLSTWMYERLLDLQEVLDRLGSLSRLERLSLAGRFRHPPGGAIPEAEAAAAWGLQGPLPAATAVALPAWPSLRHLNLAAARPFDVSLFRHKLQLSAELCSRLESLAAAEFSVPASVTAMAQLTSLQLSKLSQQQAAGGEDGEQQQAQQQQAQQQQQQAQQQQQQLGFPQLRQLIWRAESYWHDDAAVSLDEALALAQGCPLLEELDLRRTSPPAAAGQLEAARQSFALLLAREQRLTSITLPGRHGSWLHNEQEAELANWPLAALEQEGQLGALRELHIWLQLPQPWWQCLRSCTGLRDLELDHCPPEALLHLPPGLTSLKLEWVRSNDDAQPQAGTQQQAAAALPSLKRLECRVGCRCALQVLQLSQLTGLTSLLLDRGVDAQQAAAVSRLVRLVEARFGAPWAGMAAQLAGLRQLRSLQLGLQYLPEAGEQLERELRGLAGLTQLRQLVLGAWYGAESQRQLLAKVVQAMPAHCMVRKAHLAEVDRRLEHQDESD
jgi:hypothetical protein